MPKPAFSFIRFSGHSSSTLATAKTDKVCDINQALTCKLVFITPSFITTIEQGGSFWCLKRTAQFATRCSISLMLITSDRRLGLQSWYDLSFGYCICSRNTLGWIHWACVYFACMLVCVCAQKGEIPPPYPFSSVEPIIISWLRHPGKHILAVCVHAVHRQHEGYTTFTFSWEMKTIPHMGVFIFFYSLWLSWGSVQICSCFISLSHNYHVMVKLSSWFTNRAQKGCIFDSVCCQKQPWGSLKVNLR